MRPRNLFVVVVFLFVFLFNEHFSDSYNRAKCKTQNTGPTALIHWNAKSNFHRKTIQPKKEGLSRWQIEIASTVLHRVASLSAWVLGPSGSTNSRKPQTTLKPGNSSQLGSGELPQPELAQRAGFPCSLPERLQHPRQPRKGSKLPLSDPNQAFFLP